jgi:hypothetical protein
VSGQGADRAWGDWFPATVVGPKITARIKGAPHEPLASFGGFKQSGIGPETCLEARAILV